MMKVGIVGVGAVGAATAMAIVLRARVRELILINRNRARAKAVATDMHYGVPLSPLVTVADGEYSDLAGAGVAIIAAGVNEKSGGATDRNDPLGRLRPLDANVKVEEYRARSEAVEAASERLDQLAAECNLSPEMIEVIRAQQGDRLKHIDGRNTGDDISGKHGELHDEIERLLIAAERKRINDLYRSGKLKDEARRRIERELDLREAHRERDDEHG